MKNIRFFILALALPAFLSGCMVGPDFHASAPPKTKTYTEYPSPKKTIQVSAAGKAGKAQTFVYGEDIPGQWWYLFHSPQLNNLITSGLSNSPNLAAAKAALIQAKQNLYAQIGSSLLPAVNGQLTAERQRLPGAAYGGDFPSLIYNLYDVSVNVSYTLDVFGGARREIEALCAQANYQDYELKAAYLTLTSNIVTTSVTVASLRAQIEATHELIASQANQLKIVEQQFNLGGASRADTLTQQAQLEQTRATLPPLEQSLAMNYHALSVLIGQLPSEDQLPKFDLDKLTLPTNLPVSMPSSFVRQRPDIQASEALLHVASAQVGVATANMYPQFTLSGSYGYESGVPSNVFSPINSAWNFAGGLLQPIFAGGSLIAKKRAAVAAYDQANAQYRQVVLQAFQNVADTLRALQHDAQTLKAQKLAEVAARDSLKLTQQQYQLGGVNYLTLLIAQRTYQQARISRIQAQAARYTDTAALFQAMGGGWWNQKSMQKETG